MQRVVCFITDSPFLNLNKLFFNMDAFYFDQIYPLFSSPTPPRLGPALVFMIFSYTFEVRYF